MFPAIFMSQSLSSAEHFELRKEWNGQQISLRLKTTKTTNKDEKSTILYSIPDCWMGWWNVAGAIHLFLGWRYALVSARARTCRCRTHRFQINARDQNICWIIIIVRCHRNITSSCNCGAVLFPKDIRPFVPCFGIRCSSSAKHIELPAFVVHWIRSAWTGQFSESAELCLIAVTYS